MQLMSDWTDLITSLYSLCCADVQAKHREMCSNNTQELRQLKQDLDTATDMLRMHRQGINATLDATIQHVQAVHAELVEA